MVLCPSGSSPNPSSAAYAWVTWVEAQQWLGSLFSKFAWLQYALKPVLLNVANFCAVEPEQPVYPGDATVAAAFLNPIAFDTVLDWLWKSVLWWEWSQLCQCNASGSPDCLSFMFSHSSNLDSTYVWDGGRSGIRAYTDQAGRTLWGFWIDSNGTQNVSGYYMDIPTTFSHFETFHLVPGWNHVYFATPLAMAVSQNYEFGMRYGPGTNVYAGYYHNGSNPSMPTHLIGSFGGGPYDFSTWNNGSTNTNFHDPIICVYSPSTYAPAEPPPPTTSIPDVPTGPCTTIGELCGILQPVILDIGLLKSRIDLLQRRLLPFAWVAGTPHTGLTGTGAFSVLDILGVIVSFTTIPSGWGQTFETPGRRIPSMGSIQADDGTNYTDNFQLHYPNQLVMLDAPWATSVRYNLRTGCTATITPILPVP
jgi:hypothetical protein